MTAIPAGSPTREVMVFCARSETGAVLGEILEGDAWQVRQVHSCHEAIELLSAKHVPVVISESGLDDGDWRSLLERMKALPHAPPLIVTARLADDALWAEVLNLGGYDVLAQPFDKTEVIRVVTAAGRK